MIKYLGSKRLLLDEISHAMGDVGEPPTTVADLFSGTSRVVNRLRQDGHRVIANDWSAYGQVLASCYGESTQDPVELQKIIDHLNGLEPVRDPGFFTDTYCIRSRFLQPHNGLKIEAVRDEIDRMGLDPITRNVALTALLEAADRVDSTVAVQMAYLKTWAARSYNNVALRVPDRAFQSPAGYATGVDALEAARALPATVDAVYLDPPYNNHSYAGNYHVWETLVRWDAPEVYGVACKRVDVRERKSPWNGKHTASRAMKDLLGALPATVSKVVVSFNNEGHIGYDQIVGHMEEAGFRVKVAKEIAFKRYVGHQLGIHGPDGNVREGVVAGPQACTEYLFTGVRE